MEHGALSMVLSAILFGTCVSGQCPNLTLYDLDLSPISGTWDTVFFTGLEGSSTDWVPNFFNLSICGPLKDSRCDSSSVCYMSDNSFHSLGEASSRHVVYASRSVTITYRFSAAAAIPFGDGNVTINLICGRTLGVPQVVNGDPHAQEVLIVWETTAACKTSTPRHYSNESKCYHVHTYEDSGLRANLVDLTSLIRPQGYVVKSSDGTQIRVAVCKPLTASSQVNISSTCSGKMACAQRDGSSQEVVLGAWSEEDEGMKLHMHNGLLSVQYSYSQNETHCGSEDSDGGGKRLVRIHFICPRENQDLGPHIAFHDTSLCLIIISWYTSFACGNVAIQSRGCTLTTQGGQTFDLRGLSGMTDVTVRTPTPYTYSFLLCQGSFDNCDPPVTAGTRVVQRENEICRSLGTGNGYLRYADGSLSLTFHNGDSCHSNFRRTSEISFLCPDDLDAGTRSSRNNTIRFLEEEDCFYLFEWVTDAACGTKGSGVANCQFEVSNLGLYDFAPLVGTQDVTWVGLSSDESYKCFLVSPCGKLSVSDSRFSSSTDYCVTNSGSVMKAPKDCDGASVCAIMDDTVIAVGLFDLSRRSSIKAIDRDVISVSGTYKNNTAVIHYVCKPGDLSSAPVFVGTIDQTIFEFHWRTFAACPKGLIFGSGCSVSHQGYLFNLTSIPVLQFSEGAYSYNISVCSALPSSSTQCTDDPKVKAAICQYSSTTNKHYVLGQSNSTLVYQDGVLKLNYSGGGACHHISGNRNTSILFICDDSAHTASVTSITEDDCEYVVEVRTKLACPVATRASECTYHHQKHSYDFSALSRSPGQGNWETRGRDGATYIINVCQPLNLASGCHPLAGVCRAKFSRGSMTYTNLGKASNASFQFVNDDDDDDGGHVQLKYQFTSPEGVTSDCPRWTTTIELYCSDSSETGPHYVSGGGQDALCEYVFTWRTSAACPLRKVQAPSCQVVTPSNFTFDLSPLATRPDNSTVYQVGATSTAASGNGFSFNLSICSDISKPVPCKGIDGVAACQQDSVHKFHSCGLFSSEELTYFDGSLSLRYTGGDLCHRTQHNRSVLVTFECDRKASASGTTPTYMNESDCTYLFTWPTPLACLPQELDCVAAGGKYDLSPLMQRKYWEVASGIQNVTYLIGGCRSLDFRLHPECPQVPGVGACRFNRTENGGTTGGIALGYMTGNIIEENEGLLRLEYHNGELCPGGGRSMVHIHFTCGLNTREGVPTLDKSSSTCHTHINWVTQFACSRITNSSTTPTSIRRWALRDPVTSAVVNLTTLPSYVNRTYTDSHGNTYEYFVSLREGNISSVCKAGSLNISNGAVGACQVKKSSDCTKCVFVLGYLGSNVSSVSLVDRVVTAEYRGGDQCNHNGVYRQSTITFICDSRDAFLEVLPEDDCAYTFIVHTSLACTKTAPIGVECQVEGYQDLVAFQRRSWNTVSSVIPNVEFYVSACDPLGSGVRNCPSIAAACMRNRTSGVGVNLGMPSFKKPPRALGNQDGVILQYVEGDECNGSLRWHTTLLLVCNKNVLEGIPEVVSMSRSTCAVVMRWESVSACRTTLPYCPPSDDRCSMSQCTGSHANLDFTSFLRNYPLIVPTDTRGNGYAIQLCGSATPVAPPSGCDPRNTGICRISSSGGSNTTIVYANHSIAVVSDSPRVIDVTFHSGTTCSTNRNQKYSAIVHMVCSRNDETAVPRFVSDANCELHFDWRNATFCAGESVAGGCAATGRNGYVYSLDALISPIWTGVAGPSSSALGTFSLSICRNLNPFSSSGLPCSSPSAVCWHTNDGKHINLGRPSSAPHVVTETVNDTSILLEYAHGEVCNSTSKDRYSTNLYIHCSNKTTSPILSRISKASNCSWQISMTSPQACKYGPSTDSTSCSIRTASGIFNLTDLAQSPLSFTDQSGMNYSVCLCGSSRCDYPGMTLISGTSRKKLGKFLSLSVSSSTGGPRLAYYKGDDCSNGRSTTPYQSWILMECSRDASNAASNTLLETQASSACSKIFLWYTPRACHSKDVSCSILTQSHDLYDFSLLHSAYSPWTVEQKGSSVKYYINICGEIGNFPDGTSLSCGDDVSVCKVSGKSATAIGLTNTQQISVDGSGKVTVTYSGVTQSDRTVCKSTIVMECGLHHLQFDRIDNSCEHFFRWRSPYACKIDEKPQVYSSCDQLSSSSQTGPFVFHPENIPKDRTWADPHRGTFHMSLCGKSQDCDGEDSVCVSTWGGSKTGIASYTRTSIMVDGEQMLVTMNSSSSDKHAIIRVLCLEKDNVDYARLSGRVILDNIVHNSSHFYYYFTLYAEEGKECNFVNPATATAATTSSVVATVDHSRGRHSVIGAVAVVISLAVIVSILILVAIFYRKSRRDKMRRVFERLTIGKSNEVVRYQKLPKDERESLLTNDGSSSSDTSSEEIPLHTKGGAKVMDQEADDEELINL